MPAAILKTVYHIIDEHGTTYRLRPNPDCDDGFKSGAYIGWYDTDQCEAEENEIFISPNALLALAEAFTLAADEVEGKR